MWWKSKTKELEAVIVKLKNENEFLQKRLNDPYGPEAKNRLIPVSYSPFYEMLFSGFILKSREEFCTIMMDLYEKFKHADTTKEAKEYLTQMDETVASHVDFIKLLPDQVVHTPVKMRKMLEGNVSQATEDIKEIGENNHEETSDAINIDVINALNMLGQPC